MKCVFVTCVTFLIPVFSLRLGNGEYSSVEWGTEEGSNTEWTKWKNDIDAHSDFQSFTSAVDHLEALKKLAEPWDKIVALHTDFTNASDIYMRDTYMHGLFFLVNEESNELRIGKWVNRIGNNIHQLMHSIVFAEAKGISKISYPKDGAILKLFNLPEYLEITPKRSEVLCQDQSGFSFGVQCFRPFSKSDFRRALITYVKPHVTPAVAESCRSKASEDLGLAIHLRGGDLRSGGHPQSRMPPCSFYDRLIQDHNFTKVTAVAQDGASDVCVGYLTEKYNNSKVQINLQTASLAEDACAIMESQYVTYGLSTFSESLVLLNEKVKQLYVPSLKYNSMYNGKDFEYGAKGDIAGYLSCDAQECTSGKLRNFVLYDIAGIKQMRNDGQKTRYRLDTSVNISLWKSCNMCA